MPKIQNRSISGFKIGYALVVEKVTATVTTKKTFFVTNKIRLSLRYTQRSKDGMMQWPEFCELLQCLTYWFQTFNQYDLDRSGFIEAQELGRVIREKYGMICFVR